MNNAYILVVVVLTVITIVMKRKKLDSKTGATMFYSLLGVVIFLLLLHERETEVNLMQNEFIYRSVKSIIAMMKG
ncbi:hypothetical protein [Paenibacillus sp. NEAU-GSW1]|uniref:hypothetical protein n=1 Tax=Paenibacillus sp. NEAU-GSW1 TaxID=2682486 RepID=UPI0012E1B139|nr:hypothetical protein [Paenibacillus sp. NEAU-GSW1]MUT65333.1 hypothetical protein [Paenibacillus sp. NEAU-GSW1]